MRDDLVKEAWSLGMEVLGFRIGDFAYVTSSITCYCEDNRNVARMALLDSGNDGL